MQTGWEEEEYVVSFCQREPSMAGRWFQRARTEGSFGAGILKGRRGWIGVPGVVHVTERRDVYVKNKVNTNSNKFLHI